MKINKKDIEGEWIPAEFLHSNAELKIKDIYPSRSHLNVFATL